MNTREDIAFIINPHSGNGKQKNLKELINNNIDQSLYNAEIVLTQYPGHAKELAAEFVQKNFHKIVAVGGDGTMNEVASALINTSVIFGILPIGSGNGLARHLKIPMKIKDAIQLINNCQIVKIDYGTINDIPFFCTCGVGFDAKIGHQFAQSDKRGFITYFKSTISTFLSYKPKKYRLKYNDVKIKTKAFLITFANAAQYGNNAFIAPKADIHDGLLDVNILTPFPIRKALGLGFRLFNKQIHQSRYIETFKTDQITLKRKKKGEVHYDGEPAILGKKIKIKSHKQGLKVMIPHHDQ